MSSMPSARIHRILRQHVLTDRLLGIQSLPLGEVAHPRPAVQVSPAASPARPAVAALHPGERASEVLYQSEIPAAAPVERAPRLIRPALDNLPDGRTLSREQRLTVLQAMDQNEVQSCTRCILHQSRTQTVFGEGNPAAELMFIGEGPGETEDRMGRPFVGPAGELLNKMIVAMGLTREEVYIANSVKCRPPGNRVPTPDECMTCGDYLTRQIAIIRPKVIVTLGAPATHYILNTRRGITALRGRWASYDVLPDQAPIPVMPTFHPAYVLRHYTTEVRKKVWLDLQAARDRMNEA